MWIGIARLVWRSAICLAVAAQACAQSDPPERQGAEHTGVWTEGVGSGFRKGKRQAGFAGAIGIGTAVLGSKEEHDVAFVEGHYGWVLTAVLGEGRWYRGNLLLLGELFGGWQFNPDNRYFIGLTPILRYTFANGSRWVPFVDGGAGPSATNIGLPDLSGTFQFNVQLGAGVHYFVRDDFAVTLGYRWLHFSNAGIERPNLGVNTQVFRLGLDWFF